MSTRIMLGLLSPGSAEAGVGWGGNLNNDLIASCVRNTCAKYYKKLLIFLRVTINNVRDVFPGFLFISRYISFDLLSLGSAEADSRW